MTRAEAKLEGLKRYVGKPCIKGHGTERFVRNKSCVVCSNIKVSAWREQNRSYSRAVSVAWRLDNLKRSRANGRAWGIRNPDLKKACDKEWRSRNPEVLRQIANERRARKLGAEGRYTPNDIAALVDKQKNRCLCGISFKTAKRTIDHVVPLSRGGSNWPNNLQLLCQPCNDKKGVRPQIEWLKTMGVP